MSRTKHVGVFWGSFGSGRWGLCGAASWTYKEMGAGEIEKEGAMEGQRGVSRKLRVLGFWNCGGDGVRSSLEAPAFRCTQAELLACRSHPKPSLALLFVSVCDMDTATAPPSSHNTKKNPLKISGTKVGALIPKECDSVHVKSTRWQCLPSFQ